MKTKVPGLISIVRYPTRLLDIGIRCSTGGVWKAVEVMKKGEHMDVCGPEIGHLQFLDPQKGP
jgi:hypothetical protein